MFRIVKTAVIIAISAGISIVAIIGALIGIQAYQQAQLEKEQREANQAFVNLLEKVFESEQEQSTKSIPFIPPQDEIPKQENEPVPPTPSPPSQNYSGNTTYFNGIVTEITDGDTIKVDGQKIRFALVDAPEMNVTEGKLARAYVEEICPVGSHVLVDVDDGQPEGSYGRPIAVIYCNGTNLNEAVLDKDHAVIDEEYCEVSEFSDEAWVKKYGCTQTVQPKENNCDPSYPDFCIQPPPPDLNCKNIPSKKFTVLQPDPHNFDSDNDGIGCEG